MKEKQEQYLSNRDILKMERTVGVGATTITCNNPVLHSITLLFYFASTVSQTPHLF